MSAGSPSTPGSNWAGGFSPGADASREYRPGLLSRLRPNFIVFMSSMCLMAVEMVAGRLVSRSVGSSIYTWTTVIGVIFAGMSIGNYIGGRLAARWRPATILGQLFLMASFLTMTVLWLNPALSGVNSTSRYPASGHLAGGKVTVTENLAAELTERKAPTDVIDAARALVGKTFTDLDSTALAENLESLLPGKDEAAAAKRNLILAGMEPVGPAFQAMREEGVPDEALQALLQKVPEPDTDAARPSVIKFHEPLINRTVKEANEFTKHVRWSLKGSKALLERYGEEADDYLARIMNVVAGGDGKAFEAAREKGLPAGAYDAMRAAGVPAEFVARLKQHWTDSHTGRPVALKELDADPAKPAAPADAVKAALRWEDRRAGWVNSRIEHDVKTIVRCAKETTLFTFPIRLLSMVLYVFLAPAIALGLISPVAAQMAIDVGKSSGRSVGNVYAWGAWGSIIGTFLTGFVLVHLFGSFCVLALTAVALAVLGLIVAPPRLLQAAWLVVLGFMTAPVFHQLRGPTALDERPDEIAKRNDAGGPLQDFWNKVPKEFGDRIHIRDSDLSQDTAESDYQFLKVTKDSRDDGVTGEVLSLSLDHLIHGYVALKMPEGGEYNREKAVFDSGLLQYAYEKVYAVATARALSLGRAFKFESDDKGAVKVDDQGRAKVKSPPKVKSLFLGGGTYTFQRYICDTYPGEDYLTAAGDTLYLIAKAGYALESENDIRDMAARLYRHNNRRMIGVELPAGVSVSLPELGASGGPLHVPADTRVVAKGDTMRSLAAAHAGKRTPEAVRAVAGIVAAANPEALKAVRKGDEFDLEARLPAGTRLRLPELGRPADVLHVKAAEHTSAEGDTLKSIAAAHASRQSPEALPDLADRIHLENQEALAPGMIAAKFEPGLALVLPSIADVAELDPAVTQINFTRLKLARPERDPRIKTWNYDARNFVEAAVAAGWKGKYDVVYGDAFNHYNVPYHLTTVEFNDKVKELLTKDGAYIALIIDKYKTTRFLSAEVATFRKTWKHVYVFAARDRADRSHRETFVLVGADTPQTYDFLGEVADGVMDKLAKAQAEIDGPENRKPDAEVRAALLEELTRRLGESDRDGLAWLRQRLADKTVSPGALRTELAKLLAIDRVALVDTDEKAVGRFAREVVSMSPRDIDEEIVKVGRPPDFKTAVGNSLLTRAILGRAPARFEFGDDVLDKGAEGSFKAGWPRYPDEGREDMLPASVLGKLEPLRGRRFGSAEALSDELARVLSRAEVRRWKPTILRRAKDPGKQGDLVLTDDRAPVDDLLSSLFEDD